MPTIRGFILIIKEGFCSQAPFTKRRKLSNIALLRDCGWIGDNMDYEETQFI